MRLNDRVDINISLEVDPAASILADPRAETLYRVAEGALHNIEKHADARNAAVRVTLDQATGMREQANILGANLVMQSAPGTGTKIQREINT